MTKPTAPPFTLEDAEAAWQEWGANCGPAAIAAILGRRLEEIRPHLGDFESKRYTNPTLMFETLRSLGVPWRPAGLTWPRHGLVRVQWEGPWTSPGVPIRARYRYTHWVGAQQVGGETWIFDPAGRSPREGAEGRGYPTRGVSSRGRAPPPAVSANPTRGVSKPHPRCPGIVREIGAKDS